MAVMTIEESGSGLADGPAPGGPAAGTVVTALCSVTFGELAVLEVPGWDEPLRWPAADIARECGIGVGEVASRTYRFTLTETQADGRKARGFSIV